MQQNCTTLVKNVTIGLIKLRQWSSDSLLETFSRFQPDWADAIRKTYHVKLISITAICIDTFIFCGIWETQTQPLPIILSSSWVFPMELSRWVRVSARDHLSPNYLVITPGCRRPFTVPSHVVLFLPINTYLPILTNLPPSNIDMY